MGRVLGEFQDQVEQLLTGRLSQRHTDGTLVYTSAAVARGEAVFKAMEEYIWRSQNIVAQFIAT